MKIGWGFVSSDRAFIGQPGGIDGTGFAWCLHKPERQSTKGGAQVRRINSGLIVCLALLALFTTPATAADPLKIGVILPFSGPAAAYGAEARQGAELAVEEVNAAGGILGSRQLQLVFEDDRNSPQAGVAATQKLMSVNRVSAIASGMSSQVTLAQISITKNRILFVNIASQADAITEQGNPWLFQINNTVKKNAQLFNKYVVEVMKPTTVAFVGENTEFAKATLEELKSSLSTAKIDLIDVSLYDADARDFTSILTRIASLKPNLLYSVDASPARAAQFWKQVRQIGGFDKEVIAPGLITPGVLKAAEGALNGVVTGDIFVASERSEGISAFATAYRNKFGTDPGRIQLISYEAIKLIASGMDQAKSDTDYQKIAQTIRANSWNTPRGSVKFDEKGRTNAPYFYIQKVTNGELVLLDRVSN